MAYYSSLCRNLGHGLNPLAVATSYPLQPYAGDFLGTDITVGVSVADRPGVQMDNGRRSSGYVLWIVLSMYHTIYNKHSLR